jgi:hypothetical protein
MPSSSTLRSILLATLMVGVPLSIPSNLFAAPQSQAAKKAKAKPKHAATKTTSAKASKRTAQVSKPTVLASKKPTKPHDEFDSVPPPAGLPDGEAPARSSRSVTASDDSAPAPTHRRVVVAAQD